METDLVKVERSFVNIFYDHISGPPFHLPREKKVYASNVAKESYPMVWRRNHKKGHSSTDRVEVTEAEHRTVMK